MNTNLLTQHCYELTQGSAIFPSLAALNTRSIQGDAVYEALLYAAPQEFRRNDGRLRDYWLNKYSHLAESGGVYFSGLDPLQNWEPMQWGRFKANSPRLDNEGKPQKYESPIKTPNRVSYFRVDQATWELVARRYNIPMPEQLITTAEGEVLGFWSWVISHPEIPIILTEGEKKALCLLSLGFVAIGLPGIWGGRVGVGDSLERLHPDLIPVAQKGHKFVLLFDYETNPKTKWQVFNATLRTGQCIESVGCECEVALLPGSEKGIDDWAVAQGDKANRAATALMGDALSLTDYQKSFFIPVRGLKKYKPNVRVNVKKLGYAIKKLPDEGLVCLLSDMTTGKTWLGEQYRKDNPHERFLNNGHRVNLLRNLAKRLNTQMYSAVNYEDLGRVQALSITIDSLHKMANNLQAYGCLFVDEAAQYLVHLLHSKTCKNVRAEVLEVLEYLVRNSKLVVLADAHLDDITIDFFKAMRPEGEQPFIIQNDWKAGGRQTFWYEGGNSSAVVAAIHVALLEGKKIIVVSDSKRFIKKLEKSLLDSPVFGKVKTESGAQSDVEGDSEDKGRLKVWALHSENSGSEENIIRIRNITNSVKNFDAFLATPTIGTGLDICGGEGDYHFDVIFGVFHGISQSAEECVQQLWRYRPNVPMHVWAAPRPPFGYAECNPRKIKQQILERNEMTAFLIRIDRETGKRGAEKDWALDAYCKIEARRNRSINNLRQDLRSLLEEMGNTIIPMGDASNDAANSQMKEAGEAIDQAHCEAVANAITIDKKAYDYRQNKDYLSPEEFLECEKYRIHDTYGMEVTPELVKKDDGGRLVGKISNLEAILSEAQETATDEQNRSHLLPPQVVREADLSDRENFPICTDWKNRSVAWMMRQKIGLGELLRRLINGDEYSAKSDFIQPIIEAAHKHAPHIKAILGRTVSPKDSPVKIIGEFLGQLAISTISHRPSEGGRLRIYKPNPDDIEFLLQVVEYRERRREERKRKREEAAERNRSYSAGMSKQHGVDAPSTPPLKECGSTSRGGVDGISEQVEILIKGWGEKVKVEVLATEETQSATELLAESLLTIDSIEDFKEIVEWFEPTEVLDAIAASNSLPIRSKLRGFYEALRGAITYPWGNQSSSGFSFG